MKPRAAAAEGPHDDKVYKEDTEKHEDIQKIQRQQTIQKRAQDEKKVKEQGKLDHKAKKEADKRKRMLDRERNEAAVPESELVLIYPLVPYRWQFYIDDNFAAEEKLFHKEVE